MIAFVLLKCAFVAFIFLCFKIGKWCWNKPRWSVLWTKATSCFHCTCSHLQDFALTVQYRSLFLKACWGTRVAFYHQVDLHQRQECWSCHCNWLLGIFWAWSGCVDNFLAVIRAWLCAWDKIWNSFRFGITFFLFPVKSSSDPIPFI